MTLDNTTKLLVAALAVATALIQFRPGRRRVREALKLDVEILGKLPAGSEAQRRLEAYINSRIIQMIEIEEKGRIGWGDIGFGFCCAFIATIAIFSGIQNEKSSTIDAIVAALFIVAAVWGWWEGLRRRKPDGNDRTVR